MIDFTWCSLHTKEFPTDLEINMVKVSWSDYNKGKGKEKLARQNIRMWTRVDFFVHAITIIQMRTEYQNIYVVRSKLKLFLKRMIIFQIH